MLALLQKICGGVTTNLCDHVDGPQTLTATDALVVGMPHAHLRLRGGPCAVNVRRGHRAVAVLTSVRDGKRITMDHSELAGSTQRRKPSCPLRCEAQRSPTSRTRVACKRTRPSINSAVDIVEGSGLS